MKIGLVYNCPINQLTNLHAYSGTYVCACVFKYSDSSWKHHIYRAYYSNVKDTNHKYFSLLPIIIYLPGGSISRAFKRMVECGPNIKS